MKRKHLLAILMLLVFSLVLYGCQAADETTEPKGIHSGQEIR
jgi:uncharacterized lipoprotein YajG